MKRFVLSILFVVAATIGMAQVKINLRIDMNGQYGDMTEAQLKNRNEKWGKNWEEVTKPAIYAAVLAELNHSNPAVESDLSDNLYGSNPEKKRRPKKVFGNFQDAKYDLLIMLIKMDEDGETKAMVTFSDKDTGEVLFSNQYQKDGKSTRNFYRIKPNAFVYIARTVAFKIRRYQ